MRFLKLLTSKPRLKHSSVRRTIEGGNCTNGNALIKNILLSCISLLFFSSHVYGVVEVSLNSGWNLISVPEQQLNTGIKVVTASIEGKFNSIWAYSEGQWRGYFPDNPGFSDLTRMDAGQGYWVNMNQAGTLVVSGFKASSSTSIATGWNFIGFNADSNLSITEVFKEPSLSSIQLVWTFKNGQWRAFFPDNPGMSDLNTMERGQGYWVKANGSGYANYGFNLATTAKPVASSVNQGLISMTENTLVFPSGSSFQIGDIIVGEPTSVAPDGYFRKITGITQSGNQITLTTEKIPLSDVIQSGTVGGSKEFSKEDLESDALAELAIEEGISLMSASEVEAAGLPGYIGFTVDKDLVKLAGIEEVHLKGEVYIKPEFIFNAEFQGFKLKYLRVAVTGNEYSNISLRSISASGFSGNFTYTIPGTTHKFPRMKFVIGGWPVWIKPSCSLGIGVGGNLTYEYTPTINQEHNSLYGFKYSKTDGFALISSSQNNITVGSSTNFQSSFKGSLGYTCEWLIYDLAGPYATLEGYLELLKEDSQHQNDWGIYGGIEISAGLKANGYLGSELSWSMWDKTLVRKRLYPASTGNVNGQVIDASGPLNGVQVTAYKNDVQVGNPTTSDAGGNYRLQLSPDSGYKIVLSKTGYMSRTIYEITVYSNGNTSIQQVFMDQSNSPGTFSGKITNAYTGTGVPDALLAFRSGIYGGNLDGGGVVKTAVADSQGYFEVKNTTPGYYTARVSAQGFVDGSLVALCRGGLTNSNQNGALTPILDERNWRIILTWGATPSDLDSHLTGPIPNSISRFHVYYDNKTTNYANLDLDDTTSYGPETITIPKVGSGTYRYSVHDFTNRSSTSSNALSQSGAQVQVYRGNDLFKTYSVPSKSGTLWTVFEIRDGNLTDVNTMSFVTDPSIVNVIGEPDSIPDDRELFLNLPEKP